MYLLKSPLNIRDKGGGVEGKGGGGWGGALSTSVPYRLLLSKLCISFLCLYVCWIVLVIIILIIFLISFKLNKPQNNNFLTLKKHQQSSDQILSIK